MTSAQSPALKVYLALESIMLEARASKDDVNEDRILDVMDIAGEWLSESECEYLNSRDVS